MRRGRARQAARLPTRSIGAVRSPVSRSSGAHLDPGLAPAAHGANRTGRMFTGDRSGDFLFAALHRAGLASQPTSQRIGDGLELTGIYITAAARCAPPANKLTPGQLENCRPYLIDELAAIRPAVILCLGAIGWNAVLSALAMAGTVVPKPRPKFSHGGECRLGLMIILGCFHVSQQNTFTGRLTAAMIDLFLAFFVPVGFPAP